MNFFLNFITKSCSFQLQINNKTLLINADNNSIFNLKRTEKVMSEIFQKNCIIETNEKLGRHVQAKQNLRTGECILLEQPILIFSSSGDKRCNNCFKFANNYCSKCKITILCNNCTSHNEYDCKKLSSMSPDMNRELLKQFSDSYGIIKFLLLQDNTETKKYFDLILQAECHLEKRRNTDIWLGYDKNVVQPILKSNIAKYLSHGPELNENFLQRLCAICDVNSFEIRAPDSGSMRSVYVQGALFSHDCMANASIAIDDKYCIKVYANQDIQAGEIVKICYTNVLLGTDERRRMLQEGKYFHCICIRCEDPTELGSHMSTILCPKCSTGFMLKNQLENKWYCQNCPNHRTSEEIENMLEKLQNDILQTNDDIYELEMLLQKLSKILHPQHYMTIDIKQNIASILRSIINDISRCPGKNVYGRKIDLCKDILKVLQIIAPGISRLKAIVLYELGSTWAEFNRLRYQEKELSKVDLRELLQESEEMLRDSIRMLLYEPKETPEGKLLHTMMQELKYLQTDMKMLK